MNSVRKFVRLAQAYRAYKARVLQPPPPMRLWIESSARCNLRCGMCPNKDMAPGQKGLMELDLFRSIVRQAGTFASDIYLHHRGEPLLNPALPEMICAAHDAGLRTRFHSNGTLLNETWAGRLLENPPYLVSFSIDGFEKEPYEAVRVGGRFETTIENILAFARRKRAGGRRPYLVVERIRFRNPPKPENPAAIRELTRRFLDAGVDEVIVKEEYTWAGDGAPTTPCAPRPGACCTFPWYAMVICYDGTVTPCPQDFWAKLNLGNAAARPLLDIWHDEPYRDLRRSFAGNLKTICSQCDRLTRKTVGGVPWQYAMTFLTDQFLGYGPLRRWIGTAERNE